MLYVAILFASFAAGIAGGRLLHPDASVLAFVSRLQTAGVVALVFLMGVSLGGDASFWEKAGAIGLESLAFGALTALGGGFGAFAAGEWIERRRTP